MALLLSEEIALVIKKLRHQIEEAQLWGGPEADLTRRLELHKEQFKLALETESQSRYAEDMEDDLS